MASYQETDFLIRKERGVGPLSFTDFLRAYGNVRLRSNYNTSDNIDIANLLAIKREEKIHEERKSSLTWPYIKAGVEKLGEKHNLDMECYLREIWDVAHLVAPELDTREEAAVHLFQMSHNNAVLSDKQNMKLKHMFGNVKPQIERAHRAVRKIADLVSEEELHTLLAKEELPMFGANIKVGPKIPPDNYLILNKLPNLRRKKPVAEAPQKYSDFKPEIVEKQVKEKVSKSWVEAQLLRFYSNTSIVSELSDSTMTLLRSSKADNELLNEMFDLLGFERFELIQSFLQHRSEIKNPPMNKEQKNNALLDGLATQSVKEHPVYGHSDTTNQTEKQLLKEACKEEKKLYKTAKQISDGSASEDFNPETLKAMRRTRAAPDERYPNIFDIHNKAKECAAYIAGVKLSLPEGFIKTGDNIREEIWIPPLGPAPPEVGAKLLPTSNFDKIGQIAFQGCKNLNRIQTVVYPVAYHSNENLLVCAPTGAGKTNIALLTIINIVKQHIENGVIRKDKFKIVYIAPMKALASEMCKYFGKRLEPLGLTVRELTGDMHLTKPEIMATSMIITTPEKWDVTTRKPGDTQLYQLVKLLIIDEVHLLNGERGPILETLVARTLRMVEFQQSMIRIVGLSATLPNYIDVATFLRVDPFKGLFYFDSRFRPVPLELTFIGVKATERFKQLEDMNRVTFEKCLDFLEKGHQVMVFVHARNGTLRTAENLMKLTQEMGRTKLFVPEKDVSQARKDFSRTRNKKLQELLQSGIGVHHAGLLRSDRNMIENFFSQGYIKVLVCTATLAWGVNLPAHAVIIKGTDIYNNKSGTVVDLGILDVLQIFSRAGRPQFDKSGHGILITTHNKLSHYLSLLTNQYPIESSFLAHLADNLNAEVALGNITKVEEAIEWISYTYLYVRIRKNPQVYGLMFKDYQHDPNVEEFRRKAVLKAAKELDKARMVKYNQTSGDLHITDVGRIANEFYIKYDTVEIFNDFLKEVMNDGMVLALISQSSEFQQLKVRDEEMAELNNLHVQCEVPAAGGVENVRGKVNILLQSYISRIKVDSFSLVSDINYIIDNSVRITRALFEIVLHKGWPLMASRLLTMAKMIEQQVWSFESPMKQFTRLSPKIIDKIESMCLTVEKLRDMDHKEIGQMLRHERMGKEVKTAAWQFPLLSMEAVVQPITRTVLRVKLNILPDFTWSDRIHGTQEIYWIWVEDPVNNHMYHSEQFLLTKKQVQREQEQQLVFTIPIFDPMPNQIYVRAISNKWLSCESSCVMSFENLILPEQHPPYSDLLNLRPLPVTALNNSKFEILYKFTHFNPIQTQLFHCLYHTDNNVLLGAPTGSGKTIAAEIAMFRVFRESPGAKVVYIAPLKALVRERVEDWKIRLEEKLGKNVVELTGDVSPDVRAIQASDVIITTPEKWDGISRSWQTRNYVKQVSLIIIDEIHLLGEDRGPVLEVIVSRTNCICSHTNKTLRVIGLSTSLANAKDLADWLGIKQMGLYNFHPSVRPVHLDVHISGFPGKRYCPRMATMNKPTFQAIKQHSPDKPVLVFVSSRRQTRLTAIDLMRFVVVEENPKQWLRMPDHEMEQILTNIRDDNLRLCMSFGIGFHYDSLVEKDRKIVEELFVNQKIQILITTATLAWGVNFPAHLVVVKGTEYYDGKTKRYVDFPITDVLQMMGRAGRPQYDDEGVAVILVHDQKEHFYMKILNEPFPVESSLMNVLPDHLNAEIVAGTIVSKQGALDYLTWTYFFRRLLHNPSYYNLNLEEGVETKSTVNEYLSATIDRALFSLEAAYCIEIGDDKRTIETTPLGRIASNYNISYLTIQQFQEKLKKDMSMEDIINHLCDAHEYGELPFRHNEENFNEELAKSCPLQVNPYTYDSSNTKAHLLLQSHMSRLNPPCGDYLTDTKSVLDQAIRILQALLDVCGCAGWLSASLQVQVLMQMVTQARWHTDSSILTLPHVNSDILHCFSCAGHSIQCLPELIHAVDGKYERLVKMLRDKLEENQIKDVFKVLKQLPLMEIDVSISGCLANACNQSEAKVFIHGQENDSSKRWVQVHANQDYSLAVNFNRLNKTKDLRVHAPKFPKAKDEAWFLVLGDFESGDLIALKRVPPIYGRATHTLMFTTPAEPGNAVLTLYVMSDSYLGLDQQYKINLKINYAGKSAS
ncbi:activating signal cointegrator 1 complex subunit 3-like isoform X2 [Palaemon carinicauda]|uniref:activating signal cointegrator 1 complex subunit 3-like isoform X2 n=1 Tax=Palaemon carinicauda TaxID=392227 RepID=UPI0035B5B15E